MAKKTTKKKFVKKKKPSVTFDKSLIIAAVLGVVLAVGLIIIYNS
jgi:hypothetical protein